MDKKKKNGKIIFSKLNKYYILPFLIPIFSIIQKRIKAHYIEKKLKNTEYFDSIFICSSLIVGGFSYFISLIKSKKDKDDSQKNQKYIKSANYPELIYNDMNLDCKSVFILILLMSILFSSNLLIGKILVIDSNVINSRFYEIFFIAYLSKIIWKTKILYHQKFSLLVSFIGFIIITIPVVIKITKNDILTNILVLFKSILYSLFLVLIKYTTHKFFISPYSCCLNTGIISTILILIMLMIHSYFTEGDLSNLIKCFDFSDVSNKLEFYSLLILCYIFYSITQYLTYLTIYFFSPMIYIMTQIIYPLLLYFIDIISEGNYKLLDLILSIIGYLILLFAILIYHEIIIFNFWKLNKDTKIFIEKRQAEDILLIDKIDYYINDEEKRDTLNSINEDDEE